MEGDSVLSSFLSSGIYHLEGSDIVFLDPVRILNESYTRFELSRSAYYSRTFEFKSQRGSINDDGDSSYSKKKKNKKRKRKASRDLNEREIAAENRHQEARPLLVNAHRALVNAVDLLRLLPDVVKGEEELFHNVREEERNFVELATHGESSILEISLYFAMKDAEGSCLDRSNKRMTVPIFTNLISNESTEDVESEFFKRLYILPSRSSFYMSDLRKIHDLIPAQSDLGFNLIVIDPPWENGSVYQKAMYPTLPNRYFLYLPVKELAHTEGALVALWMTNREKLHVFVEKELFPAWGVTHVTVLYWLKVKPDGSLIGELDLFHHRPYESLLIGYVNMQGNPEHPAEFAHLQKNQVFISIPGAYSRKPPLEKLLFDYIPGPRPVKCLELFARELRGGWTSWGNEPLRFQDSKYFVTRSNGGPNNNKEQILN